MITLVIWRMNRLLGRLLPERFGHPKDFCFGRRGLKHTQCGAMLETKECTHSNKLILRRLLLLPASQYSYPRLLRSAADVCICRSVSNVAPHSWVCFKPLRPKQQSFRYPNLAAVFHVSKLLCSSLSGIQNFQHLCVTKPYSSLVLSRIQITLQQSFTYPNLASSSLEDVPQVRQITDFKMCYTRHTHYDIVW